MTKPLTMKKRINMYLKYRQHLGYSNHSVGGGLLKFADYVDSKRYQGPLTVTLAIEWASASPKNTRSSCAARLSLIRGFAKYYQIIEPKTEIPPENYYGVTYRRPAPYIYSEKELHDLLEVTKQLTPINGLKPITIKYILGLLASTGLRISEALHLTIQDVDLNQGILSIRESKNHKSRYVPLHPTTKKALQAYVSIRNAQVYASNDSTFFIIDNGRSLTLQQLEVAFKKLRSELGWVKNQRLYDLRHTFACRRLLIWYQQGIDIDTMMIYLSTYLGHTKITHTYWYLTATSELLSVISNKFERFIQPTQGE